MGFVRLRVYTFEGSILVTCMDQFYAFCYMVDCIWVS